MNPLEIVGLGSSTGGLPALIEFFKHMARLWHGFRGDPTPAGRQAHLGSGNPLPNHIDAGDSCRRWPECQRKSRVYHSFERPAARTPPSRPLNHSHGNSHVDNRWPKNASTRSRLVHRRSQPDDHAVIPWDEPFHAASGDAWQSRRRCRGPRRT